MLEIRYYITASGKSLFAEWFAELDAAASAKIARMEQGNLSNVKKASARAFWNIGSILVLTIGFISGETVKRSSSC